VITRIQVERPAIPASILQCAAEPPVPAGEVTQADVAEFLVDLAAAGDDCRRRLAAVRRLVQGDDDRHHP
jgi:hypothetical protein